MNNISEYNCFTEKAKNLFNCNQRMEKALKLVSEQSTPTESPKTPNKVNVPPVPDLLKGIPKALLEKVCMSWIVFGVNFLHLIFFSVLVKYPY